MSKAAGKHAWAFAPRFRRGAFGWRSAPALARIKEAMAEIKSAGRKDALLAAEGTVLFLQKLSPALEHIDSSSGAIGTAVNRAIDTLAPIIVNADLKLTHFSTERRFKSDTPALVLPTAHVAGTASRLPFTNPAAR